MSAKSLSISPRIPHSPEAREAIILGFMQDQLSVVAQYAPELNEISARFSGSYRKYISCVELLDRVDAAVSEANSFCDSVFRTTAGKAETGCNTR